MSPESDLEILAKRWRRANRGQDFQPMTDANGEEFIEAATRPGAIKLSLTDAPAGGVRVRFNGTPYDLDVTITDVAQSESVRLDFERATNSSLKVHADSNAAGTLVLRFPDTPNGTLTAAADCPGHIILSGQALLLAENFSTKARLTLRNAQCNVSGSFTAVRFEDEVEIQARRGVRIADLTLLSGTRLTTKGHILRVGTLSVDAQDQDSSIVTIVNPDKEGANQISVQSIANTTIMGEGQPHLTVKNGESLKIGGAILFEVQGLVNRLEGQRVESNIPTLRAAADALALGLVGNFELDSVSGANLEGSSEGFTIERIRTSSLASDKPAREKVGHAVIRGFRVPPGLSGRMLLAQMDDAFHLDPATQGLPGDDFRFRIRTLGIWKSWLLGSAPTESQTGRIHHDAELMRELHRLVIAKGAPGATRTRVGWCSYRLRHATTTGVVERLALTGYRWLGYGERPGPALLTWGVLSVLGAATVLGWSPDLSIDGAGRLLRESGNQATGPLAAVMRSGASSLSHQYEYVIRALVAVPLITAALALRNYVKSGSAG